MKTSTVSLILLLSSATFLLSACSSGDSNSDGAVRDVEKKSKQSSDDQMMGSVLSDTFGIEKLSLDQAFKKYANDKRGEDYLQAAQAALKVEDYPSVETLLNEVLRRNPNNGEAYFERGRARCNAIAGADDAALEDLKKAISLGAQTRDAYKFMARIYDSANKPDKAIEALNTAIKLDPQEKDLYKSRAAINVALGRKEDALRDYNKTASFDEKDCDVHFARGQLFESMKKPERAIEDYHKVIELARFRRKQKLNLKGLAYKRLATILAASGRHKEVIDILTEAMSSDERDDEELLKLRGQEYIALNLYDAAIADFDQAIDRAPEYARGTLEARAQAYERLGKIELARKDRLEAKRLEDKPAEKPVFDLKQ